MLWLKHTGKFNLKIEVLLTLKLVGLFMVQKWSFEELFTNISKEFWDLKSKN